MLSLVEIKEQPQENLAGLDNYLMVGVINDVASMGAKHADDGTTDSTAWLTITTPPVMKTGKIMYSLRATPETIKWDPESQGELDGHSVKNKLEFFIPGLQLDNLTLMAVISNADLFFIFSHNGQYHQMGNKERVAILESAKGTSGGKATDRKGITYTFAQDWSTPSPVITLTVPNIEALLLPAV